MAEVERRCRLVEQHDVGLLGERTRQHDPLTFPAGERADLAHREVGKVESFEDVHCNAAVRVGVTAKDAPMRCAPKQHIIPDEHPAGDHRALGHIGETTGPLDRLRRPCAVEFNRAGVPLVEIVSRPDIRTVEHAKAYVSELRDILLAIEVSDAKMEEGSMRVDANVSVRPMGSDELRTRCELKNINSVRSLGRAIEYEARRHVDLYTNGEAPRQETRHWDEEGGRSTAGRSKEDADDYRYFQEPDLVPLAPTSEQIAEIDASMPVLPAARRARLGECSSVADEVIVTVVERGQDGLVLGAIEAGADADKVLTRIQNDLAVDDWSAVTSESLAMLIQMETSGELTATQAKQVLGEMAAGEHGGDPRAIAAAHGFEAMESDELETLVDQLIVDHPDEWSRFVGGDDGDRKKMQGFFTGQIMKATRGQADGRAVAQLLGQKSAG